MPDTPPGERLLSTSEAARELGIHQTTLSRWTKAGYVRPAQKTVGGHMRWNIGELREQVRKITESD